MDRFEEYAKLLVEVGVNIQKGQNLVIDAPVDCAWFARAAYAAGCREVILKWNDDALTREKFLHAQPDVFDTFPRWLAELMNGYAEEGAAFLHISASDPENMAGVAPDRLTRAQRASGRALKPHRELTMSGAIPWCVASIPIPSWAKKVFPGRGEEEAMEKLWEAILRTVRVDGSGGAVERWRGHLDTMKRRMDKLNSLNLESLRSDHPPAGGGDLGGRSQRHQGRHTLHRQHAHGGALHRPPARGGGRGGLRLHAPLPQRGCH